MNFCKRADCIRKCIMHLSKYRKERCTMLNNEIKKKTDDLLMVIKGSEEYKKREELYIQLCGNPANVALLDQYERVKNELRMASIGNLPSAPEKIREFEKLNTVLYSDETIGEYLIMQMKIEQTVAEIIELVLNDCRINPEL